MNYVLSSQITYQNEEARTLVEIGVASFCESAGKVEIAEVKEPIAIYALLDFFKGGGQDIGQYLNDLYFTARKSPGGVFEEIIAWNIFVAFSSGKELNSVFHFCGTTIPKWANESAQLLAITKKDDNTTKVTTECSFPFIRKAPNSTATLEWASNPDGIPILFPDDYLGPDMVAVFETLETKRVIILSLQSKSTPSGEFNLKAALATTNPDQYYMVKVHFFLSSSFSFDHFLNLADFCCGQQTMETGVRLGCPVPRAYEGSRLQNNKTKYSARVGNIPHKKRTKKDKKKRHR